MTKSFLQEEVVKDSRTPSERRSAPRHVAWVPAYVALPSDGIERLCVTHDMSRTGGMLMTQVNLQPGEAVKVELFLRPDATQPKVARARVVRSQRRNQPNTFWSFDTAVEYDEPMDDVEAAVEEISAKQRGWWPGR